LVNHGLFTNLVIKIELINISASMHDANTIFVAVGRYAFSPAALVFPDVSNIPFCSINHDCYCDIPCM
jgi:hypothetical protein